MTQSEPTIFLASTSPRRRELLTGLGLDYVPLDPGVEEVPFPNETARAYAARNAKLKAEAVLKLEEVTSQRVVAVIAADTIVVLDRHILEKPRDQTEACVMLARLSGRTHTVYTGLYILAGPPAKLTAHARLVATEVTMKTLAAGEIVAYVATGEPLDKAGAYAAQGRGSYMVQKIAGSFTNVVGLPLTELVQILTERCGITMWPADLP